MHLSLFIILEAFSKIYDKEINGITFNQMSTEFKIRAMNDVAALDSAVEAYFPGYKESFSSKYQIAAEFVSSKYIDVVDAIKEYLQMYVESHQLDIQYYKEYGWDPVEIF